MKTIGPKAVTVTSPTGETSWTAVLRRSNWTHRVVLLHTRPEPTVDPKDVDTQLDLVYEAKTTTLRNRNNVLDQMHKMVGDRCLHSGWRMRDETVLADARKHAYSDAPNTCTPYNPKALVSRFDEATQRLAELDTRRCDLEAPYRRNPWSRFFLVPGGHIHSNRNCRTCYGTTTYTWLPLLSGETEREAVEAHGPLLCSVCFPTAPVEWTTGPAKPERCQGTVDPDHKPFRVGMNTYYQCTCGCVTTRNADGSLRKHDPAS